MPIKNKNNRHERTQIEFFLNLYSSISNKFMYHR